MYREILKKKELWLGDKNIHENGCFFILVNIKLMKLGIKFNNTIYSITVIKLKIYNLI